VGASKLEKTEEIALPAIGLRKETVLDAGNIVLLLVAVALVAANGFFVAAEFSLVKVRKTRIDQLVAEGKGAARVVQREIDHLDNYIAATQLGITLASLSLGWIGEPALAYLIEPLFKAFLPAGAATTAAHTIAIIVAFTIITTFHIVLGELVPKSIALQRAEATALFVARPLMIFNRLFRPFIIMMNGLGNLVVKVFGMQTNANEHGSVHSVEELEMLVTQSREAGVLDQSEEVLLRRVFDFSDKSANSVMMPRTEIVGIPKNITLEELVKVAAEEHYTRLPVYDSSLDNIIGILHVKDLFSVVHQNFSYNGQTAFDVTKIMRKVLKVPETVSLEDLLARMKREQVHLTVVIDEYGGTAGIVTIEDILEEIVGAVGDEFDTVEEGQKPEIQALPDGTTLVSGLVTITTFAERFGLSLPDTDYETIAGYVFGELGRTPEIGDKIAVQNYEIRVEEMDGLRIDRLKVIPHKPATLEETIGKLPPPQLVTAKTNNLAKSKTIPVQ
jgi:CBS domain containing-hemolysin-like protein